jgi:hypothetical protein
MRVDYITPIGKRAPKPKGRKAAQATFTFDVAAATEEDVE